MNIAVLFDGAGLARLGLEQAGHTCTGYELDPSKHYLSKFVGSGNCILQDATTVNLDSFDAIWASPPCQYYSDQKTNSKQSQYGDNSLLDWSISLIDKYPDKVIWIENVISRKHDNSWGTKYNAAQFLNYPIQIRSRLIGGRFNKPQLFRSYKKHYKEFKDIAPPACLASELYHGGFAKDITKERRKFSKWYKLNLGRYPNIFDMAFVQGFNMPLEWANESNLKNISSALGNGVPVYMAKAFGDVYKCTK